MDRGLKDRVRLFHASDLCGHHLSREILGQYRDRTAAGHGLSHPTAADRGHVRRHHRQRRLHAVRTSQVDLGTGSDVGTVRRQKHVAVGEVMGRLVVQETHLRILSRPAGRRTSNEDPVEPTSDVR